MKLFQIETRHPSEIITQDRTRQVYGDLTSLKDSIEMVGQLNPILIDSDNNLIDGLHRLTAIQEMNLPTIEVRIIDGITANDKKLIELLANLDRREFKWHEEIKLKHELHTFWKQEAEENNKSWGYRDTAKRLKCSLGGLSTDLTLAEAIKVFPELSEQKTKGRARELYKAYGNKAQAIQRMNTLSNEEKSNLEKLKTGQVNIPVKNTPREEVKKRNNKSKNELSKITENTPSEEQNYEDVNVVYVAENYKNFLNKIPNNSVGMVELDPPYSIDFNTTYGKTSNISCKADDWTSAELYDFYNNYLSIIYEKMLDCSWLLCWTGKEHFMTIQSLASDVGFFVQEPGVWVKPGGGSTNQPKKNLVSNWEMYLILRKGEAQFNTPSLMSAINIHTVAASQRIHQWEKPIELYDHFIKALGQPGSIFLSLFAGSGNCLISAAKAKMTPIGCDKSQKYIPEFYSRLNNYLGINANVRGI